MRSLAEAKEQHISLDLPRSPIAVHADRRRLSIVVVNLLSNAVKFTSTQGRIGVRAQRTGDAASLMVWDTGIGIPEKNLGRIFDRFYQVEPSLARHYEGMGLGLAIVREMVDLHNGHIKVDSQEGRGSAFTVTIPIRQPSDGA
jgi:two-component system sensor histidine kinase VicK